MLNGRRNGVVWPGVHVQRHPDAVAIGPGLGQAAEALYVLASNRSLIQQLKRRKALACITPHPGEAARLLGRSSQEVQAHREQSLTDLVELTGCVVVLKGQHSLLAPPLHPSVQCMDGKQRFWVFKRFPWPPINC